MPNDEIHSTGMKRLEKIDHGVEVWAERHRLEGHHPHPAPTDVNPERWDCDCGRVNRILTGEQIRMKFAHLSAAANVRRESPHAQDVGHRHRRPAAGPRASLRNQRRLRATGPSTARGRSQTPDLTHHHQPVADTLMGRFVSATGPFLLATNGQSPRPPKGRNRSPLTISKPPTPNGSGARPTSGGNAVTDQHCSPRAVRTPVAT